MIQSKIKEETREADDRPADRPFNAGGGAGGRYRAGCRRAPALAARKAALGPYGYGNLKLGMTATKARATGRIVHKASGTPPGARARDLKENPYGEYRVGMYISKKRGVSMIVAPPPA